MEKFTYINEIDYDESITSESPFPEWIKTGELFRCQASRIPASTTELTLQRFWSSQVGVIPTLECQNILT
jgi:hypothetical protein